MDKFTKETIEFWRNQRKIKKAQNVSSSYRSSPEAVVSVEHFDGTQQFGALLKKLGGIAVYVGIPAGTPDERIARIVRRAGKFTSLRKSRAVKKQNLVQVANTSTLSNAHILQIFSKGSPLNNQPARPVLEPAIHAEGNKEVIAALVAQASALYLQGKLYEAKLLLRSAGAAAAEACRKWFNDPRNHWAPNSPSTIVHKGEDYPGVYSDIMRNAITWIMKEVS